MNTKTKAYRVQAGELVAKTAKFIGSTSLMNSYICRFGGVAYFSNDTGDLADQIAAAMRSQAMAENQRKIKRNKKKVVKSHG